MQKHGMEQQEDLGSSVNSTDSIAGELNDLGYTPFIFWATESAYI